MKIFLIILMVMLTTLTYASTIQTKRGPVDFPHPPHSAIMQCLECHMSHGGGMMGMFSMTGITVDANHNFCFTCHDPKEIAEKCKFCHQKKVK
jgi:predicted CXXCH cytochrome family protein